MKRFIMFGLGTLSFLLAAELVFAYRHSLEASAQDGGNSEVIKFFTKTIQLDVTGGTTKGFEVPPSFVGHIYMSCPDYDAGQANAIFVVVSDKYRMLNGTVNQPNNGYAHRIAGVGLADIEIKRDDEAKTQWFIQSIKLQPPNHETKIKKIVVTMVGQAY